VFSLYFNVKLEKDEKVEGIGNFLLKKTKRARHEPFASRPFGTEIK
jgi:hypothetical protein